MAAASLASFPSIHHRGSLAAGAPRASVRFAPRATAALSAPSPPAVRYVPPLKPAAPTPPVHSLPVSRRIPPFINGAYARNGANPCFDPVAGGHLFDGDGMQHAVCIRNGGAESYACRFTETARVKQERTLGRAVLPKAIGELHGHSGIALFYQRELCGLVDTSWGTWLAITRLDYFNGRPLADGDLETVGRYEFDGQLGCAMIAHPKLDPASGDLFTLNYDVIKRAYCKYFYFPPDGIRSDDVEIPLDQPTMIHDFSITENHVVVPDHQVVFKLAEMFCRGSPVVLDTAKYAADASEMVWVDVADCFRLWNAWEDDTIGEIVVIGSCMTPADYIFNDPDDCLQSVLTY